MKYHYIDQLFRLPNIVRKNYYYLTYDIFGLDVQILASQVYHGNGKQFGILENR